MGSPRDDSAPLLARVPAGELEIQLPAGTGSWKSVSRPKGPSVLKRVIAYVFLGMGVMSVVSLARAAVVSTRDGLDIRDLALIGLLALLTFAIGAQALAVAGTLPGGRQLHQRIAVARQRHIVLETSPLPLLARVPAGEILSDLPPAESTRPTSRLRRATATVGWVGLTLLVMGLGAGAALALATSAVRGIGSVGLTVGTLAGSAMALLVGFGTRSMSAVLIRSWYERRLRRPGRMLRRLLRFLLRLGDRSVVSARRTMRMGRAGGLPARLVATAAGTVLLVGVAFAAPVGSSAEPSSEAGVDVMVAGLQLEPGSASPDDSAGSGAGEGTAGDRHNGDGDADHEGTGSSGSGSPGVGSSGAGLSPTTSTTEPVGWTSTTVASKATSTTTAWRSSTTTAPKPTTTTAPKPTTTTTAPKPTTTTAPKPTTTTTAPKPTTTTTVPKPTTTTTKPADTTGPAVTGVGANPVVVFTSGSSQLGATVTDPSGVATVTIYYRVNSGTFAVWGSMVPGKAGSYSMTFGPLMTAGIYEYRVVAVDTVGNASCSSRAPATCPGGTVTVIIP